MTMELFIELVWKSSLCAGLALLLLRAMRRRSAAERAMVANFGLVTVLLLPLGSLLLPRFEWSAPPAVSHALARLPVEGFTIGDAVALPAAAASVDWASFLFFGYLAPAAGLLLVTAIGLLHLGRVRERAELVMDAHWLDALAAAQQRLDTDQSAELLASRELSSPVSWGILRPVIIVDAKGAQDRAAAEAIIAHELAHLARMDWLSLLLARLATALYWFNPLVWLLARCTGDLIEQAADDVVLRGRIERVDYAELLIAAARQANRGRMRTANGIAPGSRALGRRVIGILDPKRSRVPARLGWSAACLAGALAIGTSLAALQPRLAAAADELAALTGVQMPVLPAPAWLNKLDAWRPRGASPAEPVPDVPAEPAAAERAPEPQRAAAPDRIAPETARALAPVVIDVSALPAPPPTIILAPPPPIALPGVAPPPTAEPAPIAAASTTALAAEVAQPTAEPAARQPAAAGRAEKVTCRRYAVTGSRTKTERICMTGQEWFKAEGRLRESWHSTTTTGRRT